MKSVKGIKKEFPFFEKNDIIYLDNAATTQKPKCVLNCVRDFYENVNANPHSGVYGLGLKAGEEFENARATVAKFLNAKFPEEIVFTKNASEALNLVALSYGLDHVKKGDEIVLSIMEHHSALVPWQQIAKQKKAKLSYLYVNKNFEIDDAEIDKKLTPNTKIVQILTTSNVLGTKNDVEKIIKKAHSVGAVVIVDATQSVAHEKFDVQKTDADFVAFSAHKMYGPLGVGVLYGKKKLLEKMNPLFMGGGQIEFVYEDKTTFASLPAKFEAGTQNVAGVLGLCEAINFLEKIGYKNIAKHEKSLTEYALKQLVKLPFLTIYAPRENYSGVVSFNIKGLHPHDVASFLNEKKICVRAGNHCAQPLLRFLGIDGTCRASFGIYNDKNDVDALVAALKEIYTKFEKYLGK